MKVPGRHLGLKKPRIEMLPLIDIVFLLLVFFIYAMLSMAVHRSLPVVLPTSTAAAVDPELNLSVTVRHSGEIFLADQKVSLEELTAVLQDRIRDAAGAEAVQVDLFADRAISYQQLYKVLDSIRTAGISNVSLQSDPVE